MDKKQYHREGEHYTLDVTVDLRPKTIALTLAIAAAIAGGCYLWLK